MRDPADIGRALEAVRAGRLIVMPTDTVYGVAAHPDAAGAIFGAKKRSRDKALPVLAAHLADLSPVAVVDERISMLARAFWPGPLTLVLERAAGFDADLGGRARTVAVRVPACSVALALLRRSGPLAVTSANRSGEPAATSVDEARRSLGDAVDVFIDGGPRSGAPSTIVSLVGNISVLREGSLKAAEVLAVAGR
ncbi:MAG: L-threonylcarbamoyladenylate synthase [Actinomycetota bacterium]